MSWVDIAVYILKDVLLPILIAVAGTLTVVFLGNRRKDRQHGKQFVAPEPEMQQQLQQLSQRQQEVRHQQQQQPQWRRRSKRRR